MKATAFRVATIGVIMGALVCGAASGDVQVSVTLSGDLDEILEILAQLQNMGIGTARTEETLDPLRLEVHSISVGSLDDPVPTDPPEAEEPEEDQPVQPQLRHATIDPSPIEAGQDVLVTVDVIDPQLEIDTVGMTIAPSDGPALAMDLFDNGQHGDQVAGDGTWSRLFAVPADVSVEDYTYVITAYDRNGQPVRLEDGEPLTLTGDVPVTE